MDLTFSTPSITQGVQALMSAAADELHQGHRIITSTETKRVMDSVLAMTHTSGP